jgi:hypothetical protein
MSAIFLVFKVIKRYGHGHGKMNLKRGIVTAKGGSTSRCHAEINRYKRKFST